MISKNEVRAFINPYLASDLTNITSTTETITRYISYDKELVEANKESIYKFIFENFNINSVCVYLERLIEDKCEREWNSLRSLEDLELLEELLGLAIVSGLFKDDLRMRFQVITNAGPLAKILNPEIMDLSTEFLVNAYLASMRNLILPTMFFKVDEKIYKEYKCDKKEYSKEEKKGILCYWFKEMNSLRVTDDEYDKFMSLVDEKTDTILDVAVMLKLLRQSSETFLINMKFDSNMTFINDILSRISTFSPEQREYFEEVKRVFLIDIEKMKKRFDGNDDMKKTLH